MQKIHPSTYILAAILFVVYIFLTPHAGHVYDTGCWSSWLGLIYEKGLGKCYTTDINYLPGHLYIFKIFSLLAPSRDYAMQHIYYLKYFSLIFDFAGALLLSSFAIKKSGQIALLLSILLNISFLHNTMLWGQFDSVFSFFAFAAVVAAAKNKLLPSAILYLIALNFKFQAILFLPLMFLIFVYQVNFRFDWKKFLTGIIALILLQSIILLPWIFVHQSTAVFVVVKSLFGFYTYVSLCAGNIWHLMIPGDLRFTGDDNTWHGITFKTWGFFMLMGSLLLSLSPLLWKILLKLRKKSAYIPLETIFAMGFLSVMSFFFFSTQMHERYTFPAFLFLAAYCYYTRHWWNYVIFSLAYFLNNELALAYFHFNFRSTWFDLSSIAKIYLLGYLLVLIPFFIRLRKSGLQEI